jgi:hypothetical protein
MLTKILDDELVATRCSRFASQGDIVLHRETLVVRDAGNSRFQVFDHDGKLREVMDLRSQSDTNRLRL